MAKLRELKGLGPKSEKYLSEIGIHTIEQLRKIGAVSAFIKLNKESSAKPSLNFLYAMVGALEGAHWADIAKSDKGRLLFELEGYEKLEEILKEETAIHDDYHDADAQKELQKIPGIGKSLSKDLIDLGYKHATELEGENPEAMYEKLMQLRGSHIDRCVLYVFRCAVYYASNPLPEPELLKWWNWKDETHKI